MRNDDREMTDDEAKQHMIRAGTFACLNSSDLLAALQAYHRMATDPSERARRAELVVQFAISVGYDAAYADEHLR